MTGDPGEAVISLLEEEHGIPRTGLLPSSRLVHDLGVGGGDAADLFRCLHERFGTDFTALDEHWTEFFRHEGARPMSVPIGLAPLVPAAASTVPVAAALHRVRLVSTVPEGWILRAPSLGGG